MVKRVTGGILVLLAACHQGETPANKAAPAPTPVVETDVGAAQRLVRQRLGAGGAVRFTEAARRTSQGVAIVCGTYEQSGARQRYIVVGGTDAFIEPQMRAGEMDRAYTEFCAAGAQG